MKYRLAWKSKITGVKGVGKWLDDYDLLKTWLNAANEEFPKLHHWIESDNGKEEVNHDK